jgi:hypothetical protein
VITVVLSHIASRLTGSIGAGFTLASFSVACCLLLALVAWYVERRRALSIFVFDLLVGWPGLGLIITLVSACLNPPSLRTRIE